jgi:hypothetical protein
MPLSGNPFKGWGSTGSGARSWSPPGEVPAPRRKDLVAARARAAGHADAVLRARHEFDALIEALCGDLFDTEASEGLLLWLVDVQPRARQAWTELSERPRASAKPGTPRPPITHTDRPEGTQQDGYRRASRRGPELDCAPAEWWALRTGSSVAHSNSSLPSKVAHESMTKAIPMAPMRAGTTAL